MGKLYFSILALGIFLAASFGFIIPYGVSAEDDVGVLATFGYLAVLVPSVSYYFVRYIVKHTKQTFKQLKGASQ